MVDKKLTELDEITSLSNDDLIYAVDAPGTSPASKKITVANAIPKISTDTYANIPAASKDGNLFLPNDGFEVLRDTGAAWIPWGPIYPFTIPPTDGWSWINQGSATVVTSGGGIFLRTPALAGDNNRLYVRNIPSTPYTIYTAFSYYGDGNGDSGEGIGFRKSSTGEFIFFKHEALHKILVQAWNSPTSWNGNAFSANSQDRSLSFLGLGDDGTDYRYYYISPDGNNWILLYREGRTNFITADQVFIGVNSKTTGCDAGIILYSWKET